MLFRSEPEEKRLQPELRILQGDPRGIAGAAESANSFILDGGHVHSGEVAGPEDPPQPDGSILFPPPFGRGARLSPSLFKYRKRLLQLGTRDFVKQSDESGADGDEHWACLWKVSLADEKEDILAGYELYADLWEYDVTTSPDSLLPTGLCTDRKSTRLNSSHMSESRMPSSA